MSARALQLVDHLIASVNSKDSSMAAEAKNDEFKSGIEFDADNIFAKIIKCDIPCHKIFENEHVIATLDAFPSAPGHSLLVSKVKKASILDFTEDEAANYLKYLPKLSQIVKTATGCSAVNIIANNGKDSGQVVFQAHFHCIPRNKEDGVFKNPKGAKQMITADEGKAMLSKMGIS